MRVFITGVAGFIGSRLARRCLARGDEVVGVDSFTPYYDIAAKRRNVEELSGDLSFSLLETDLADVATYRSELAASEIVFHQAGQPGVRASWAEGFEGYVAHNLMVTKQLLEALSEIHANGDSRLKRLVYASSSSVYGDAMTFPTDEATTPAPFSPYGVTKLAAEHLCGAYARNWGLPTVSLRYFTVFGGGQRPDMALHRLINAALGGPPFPLFGDGHQRRDFTHVSDVVTANLLAAEADVQAGEVMNIAGGTDATVVDLIEEVELATGNTVSIDQRTAQAGDVRRTGGATDRAKKRLGWTPQVGLREGILEQVEWHRTNSIPVDREARRVATVL